MAHNAGTEDALRKFITECYEPPIYEQLDLASHVAFYKQIISDFGPLNNQIYEKVEETRSKLIVHLIKKNESLLKNKIDPAEILVVEMDMSKVYPKHMSRGLGLGALVCELRKK